MIFFSCYFAGLALLACYDRRTTYERGREWRRAWHGALQASKRFLDGWERSSKRNNSILAQCRQWKREAIRQREDAFQSTAEAWNERDEAKEAAKRAYEIAGEWQRKFNYCEATNQELAFLLDAAEIKLAKARGKKGKRLKVQT